MSTRQLLYNEINKDIRCIYIRQYDAMASIIKCTEVNGYTLHVFLDIIEALTSSVTYPFTNIVHVCVRTCVSHAGLKSYLQL